MWLMMDFLEKYTQLAFNNISFKFCHKLTFVLLETSVILVSIHIVFVNILSQILFSACFQFNFSNFVCIFVIFY